MVPPQHLSVPALSLYSTATQNTWRRGLALGSAPDARILRWGYQHVGILEPTQTLALGVICVTPDANPRRQSVEYRWRWVPNANFLRWPCTFPFFWCRFHLRWVANTKPISSGIWALKSIVRSPYQWDLPEPHSLYRSKIIIKSISHAQF